MSDDIELVESPRPVDEEAYWKRVEDSTPGRRIAFWWQKKTGHPSMFELADRIDAELDWARISSVAKETESVHTFVRALPPAERLAFLEKITDGFCVRCGRNIDPLYRKCHCDNDE